MKDETNTPVGSAAGHCSVEDTPRTNEREAMSYGLHEGWGLALARQLERELNAATAENNRLMDVIKRARTEFFRDGADGMAAVNMLSALNDA